MANSCFNEVAVTAQSDEELSQFIETVSTPECPLDFSKIAPVPAIFEHLHNEKRKLDGKAVSYWMAETDEQGKPINPSLLTEDEWQALARTGASNRADWLSANWGYPCQPDGIEQCAEDTKITYTFYTTWGPPREIFTALRALFPELTITALFEEPGMRLTGFC